MTTTINTKKRHATIRGSRCTLLGLMTLAAVSMSTPEARAGTITFDPGGDICSFSGSWALDGVDDFVAETHFQTNFLFQTGVMNDEYFTWVNIMPVGHNDFSFVFSDPGGVGQVEFHDGHTDTYHISLIRFDTVSGASSGLFSFSTSGCDNHVPEGCIPLGLTGIALGGCLWVHQRGVGRRRAE